ncbi:hypothetical protein BN946_scf185002.g43 [Trametes cinnabarina]|uniref:Uncharacterized protein n=1 Tax=Pycnoporus cinnabarinus TaxID=5643 RepID=A0A060SKC2_PYCCI|nr:hypothetical protein BN946_scf185002.g43 [Trametes cinnabarina]
MDACPPIITEAALRASWATFDASTRAALIGMFASRGHTGSAGPVPARQRVAAGTQPAPIQTGLPPPRGNPYGDEGYAGEDEREERNILGTRTAQAATNGAHSARNQAGQENNGHNPACRRRRLSPGGRYANIGEYNGTLTKQNPRAYMECREDPALLEEEPTDEYVELMSKNNELEARVRMLETHLPDHPADADDSTSDEDDDVVYNPDGSAAEKDDVDPLVLLQLNTHSLSPMQKKALSKIQTSVTTAFRETTGVLASDQPWPRWSKDGVFPGMAVNFEATVEHCVNRALFRRVAEVAMQDLKKHAPVHADWMSASDVKLTLGLLFEVAKRSFRGFKRVYKAQFDEEQRNQLNANARAARWLNRRRKKCSNLLKVTAMYMEKHGVDPTPLIVQEMMSDEASGPEDEATESQAEWKRRMADCAGVTKKTDEQLAKMVFFEAVHPNWRSEALTQILHELWSLFWQAVSTRTARAMTPRITDTDRQSDEPPQTAPYNFGINQDWYEQFKDSNTHKVALKDWMNYPDPEGFGENAEVPDDAQENENGVA